ncbi:thiol-disulfide oxidoreductase DCC family protein [Streptomyces sp. NPDC053499]|uniref:thiol-disulfide oxidoreductase DCC family protein n=1 Tax=Streptomyces sp. NPDC053499 TaxID=3365707 RepID=UPI0037D66E11
MRNQSLPVLLYDGDCGFCTSAVRFAERRVRPRCTYEPWQFADPAELAALGVTRERAEHEVLWVTPAGAVYGGAQAVAKALLSAGGGAWPVVGAVLTLPPFRWAAHVGYRVIAANRHRLPGGTAACAVARSHSAS